MSNDPLPILLRSLRLPTMSEEYAKAIATAEAENWGYRRFLLHLAEAGTSDRTSRRIQRMLDGSGLPAGKTFATLDPNKWPEKIRRQLPTLLEADFVRRGDTVCAFGLPGRGKSSFVAALAREWIQRHQFRVLFTPTFKLVGQLLAAKRDLKLNALLAKLQRYDAVCLDEPATPSSPARRATCSSSSWPSATKRRPSSSPQTSSSASGTKSFTTR
jgi:DNA replication protein DnaC